MKNKVVITIFAVFLCAIVVLLYLNRHSPIFGVPLPPNNSAVSDDGSKPVAINATYDKEFPFKAEFVKIENGCMYVRFFNYSDYEISWFRINYEFFDADENFISESSYNQSSYPIFLRAKSMRVEELPFKVPADAHTAKVELMEVDTD